MTKKGLADVTESRTIYLAGGCFWGVEAFLAEIPGVKSTRVGYANGVTKNPTYEQVCKKDTGHAEAVEIVYNPNEISLPKLLNIYFDIIDPTSLNRQGGDAGPQYRTGVYYTDDTDRDVAANVFKLKASKLPSPIVTELERLKCFYPAEEYHQKYLEKNPNGYCHIDLSQTKKYK
ncbi:peptide-methionine (S)-S-oxide reductase/peptide methionine sulfoxide reductase msrA/msrB [Parelusimicrobium proximum]|uniref:peptide-methionine (S)-S-oxide reductase MsrA n=1 Tax=Parelusimicrobium proximum TaxID=3228953 RepID=UPI003D184AE7